MTDLLGWGSYYRILNMPLQAYRRFAPTAEGQRYWTHEWAFRFGLATQDH